MIQVFQRANYVDEICYLTSAVTLLRGCFFSSKNKAADLLEQLYIRCLRFLKRSLEIVLISNPADKISLLLC